MAPGQKFLGFFMDYINDQFCQTTITIPVKVVEKVYHQVAVSHQKKISAYGFHKHEVPLEYVKANFQPYLNEVVTEFLFKYFVISFLYKQIRINRISIAGEPRLTKISIEQNTDAQYCFEFAISEPINLQNWKKLPFKAPKRKQYRDIDRQAQTFIEEENTKQNKYNDNGIQIGDWVAFNITLLDDNNQKLFEEKEHLWLKIGDEESDLPCQEIFVGAQKGDSFYTKSSCLQEYFNSQMGIEYSFEVEITDILSQSYFSFEYLKKHFNIKTQKEIIQKIVEVYSFRNDISQRKSTIEEATNILINNHKFNVPHFLILRQQKNIIDTLHDNPDYYVYRMEKDFNLQIEKLAKKQIKEEILIDQICRDEKLKIQNDEIKQYLNFLSRPRTKDFVYFQAPNTKIHGQEFPISQEILVQTCLREKTLNHVIFNLMQ